MYLQDNTVMCKNEDKKNKSGFLPSSLGLSQQCKDTTRRCISLIGSCIEGNK